MAVVQAADRHTVVTTGWTNPSNAYATSGDNTYATAAPAKNATVNGDFGFPALGIPAGATIISVKVEVEWGMTAAVTGGTLGLKGRNNGVDDSAAEVTKTTTPEAVSIFTFGTLPSVTDLNTAGRVVARVRCSKGNTNSAMTGNLDYVFLTVVYQTTYDQDSYRFRNDDGSETTATWRQAVNTPDSIAVDTRFRLRFAFEDTNGGGEMPGGEVFSLQFRQKPSGGSFGSWMNIDSGLFQPVGYDDTSNFAGSGGTPATRQIWASATGYQNGFCLDDAPGAGSDFLNYAPNFKTEWEWSIKLVSANGAAAGDTFEFRMVRGGGGSTTAFDSYTNTPSLTVGSSGPQNVTLPIATETDSAQALTAKKSAAAPVATETDTAQALTAKKAVALPVATETDSARPLTEKPHLPMALETDAAVGLTAGKRANVPAAGETDTAVALTGSKKAPLPVAGETEAGQALTAKKSAVLPAGAETDTAQTLALHGNATLPTAAETDTAQTLGAVKRATVPVSAETDAARPLAAVKTVVNLPIALETDTARPLTAQKRLTLPVANETDTAVVLELQTPPPPDTGLHEKTKVGVGL